MKKINVNDEILNIKEVANLLKVHYKTIERWRKTKSMPYIKLSGCVRYSKVDVLRWLELCKQ